MNVKKLVSVLTLVGVTTTLSYASTTITWGTSPQSPGLYHLFQADSTTPITGDRTGTAGTGGLLQIINVGANGYDGFYSGTTYGTSSEAGAGNDVFIGYSWVGNGTPGPLIQPGNFTTTGTAHTMPDNTACVIRFFTAPSWNGAAYTGSAPVSGTYGYVSGFTTTSDPIDYFTIGGSQTANLAVPEPGSIVLGLLGVATVLAARRARAK